MFGLSSGHRATFGLDIGFNTLKVAQLNPRGNSFGLRGLNIVSIPENCLTKAGVQHPQELIAALTKALQEAKPHAISAPVAVSALPESLVFTKVITLPALKTSQLEKTIPYEASEIFPVPMEEIYLDWQVINHHAAPPDPTENLHKSDPKLPPGNSPVVQPPPKINPQGKNVTYNDILLIAAPRPLVNSYRSVMVSAGFELGILETKPIAISRALVKPGETGEYLLVDIGAVNTSIILVDKGTLRFTTTVACGANIVLETSPTVAKPADTPPVLNKTASDIIPVKISNDELIAKNIAPVIDEINHTIRYYHDRIQSSGKISAIRLTGGGANLPSVTSIIAAKTGYKVEMSNPFTNISHLPKDLNKETIQSYATALGCAQRHLK